MHNNKDIILAAILAVVLSFALFGNGIGGDFVFDDTIVIVGNPFISGQLDGFWEIFVTPYFAYQPLPGLYRPLTIASYSLNAFLFGHSPVSFHIVNILLHALTSFLVFVLLYRLSASRIASFAGFLFFMFLPIHVEAITSIVGRAEILSLLFVVGALLSVLKQRYVFASALFFFGLLSKEMAVAFLPIFLFMELYIKNKNIKKTLSRSLYFIPAVIFYAVLRYVALGEYFLRNDATAVYNPIKFAPFFSGLWMSFKVFYLYLTKTFFPLHLSSDYSFGQIPLTESSFASFEVALGIAIFCLIALLFFKTKDLLTRFGIIIFLASYFVISNWVFKTGTIMAERLMYMPSLGLVILASVIIQNVKIPPTLKLWRASKMAYSAEAASAAKAGQNDNAKFKILNLPPKFFAFSFSLLVLFVWYGYVIIDRNKDWLNEKNLFESAYAVAPNSVVNITNMASILFREGKNEEALEKINTALDIEPKNSPTLHLGGQIYERMGEDKIAEEWWRKAILAQSDYLYPYLSMGALYYQRGDFESGKEILLKATETYSTPNVLTLLAFNQIGLEEYSEIIDLLEKKFGKKPKEYEIRFVLGVAYLKSGDDPKARELLLELKDPALTEEVFIKNLKDTKVFDIEI